MPGILVRAQGLRSDSCSGAAQLLLQLESLLCAFETSGAMLAPDAWQVGKACIPMCCWSATTGRQHAASRGRTALAGKACHRAGQLWCSCSPLPLLSPTKCWPYQPFAGRSQQRMLAWNAGMPSYLLALAGAAAWHGHCAAAAEPADRVGGQHGRHHSPGCLRAGADHPGLAQGLWPARVPVPVQGAQLGARAAGVVPSACKGCTVCAVNCTPRRQASTAGRDCAHVASAQRVAHSRCTGRWPAAVAQLVWTQTAVQHLCAQLLQCLS